MRSERLVESRAATLELTDEEARALRRLGRSLTSDTQWWGDPEEQDVGTLKPTTVIDVRKTDRDGMWQVKVKDAIGLVSLGELQLEVEPKIPLDHLLYLFERAEAVPRLEDTIGQAKVDDAFWQLIARWYLSELEAVLRRDLIRGYEHHQERLATVKGRIDPVQVASAYYRGNLEFVCEFEEFKADTPLNRTLRAAARKVSSIQTLDRPTRRRGISGVRRMEQVGDMKPGDLNAPLSRSTAHYRNAILLARHLLGEVGRLPVSGSTYARTFLIPTPKLVEKGVLGVLRDHLGPEWDIRPRKFALEPSSVTVNPDLVFNDGFAVGDVKYKLFAEDWSRSDLYQSVAFATAFQTGVGGVIGFTGESETSPADVKIGQVTVTALSWRTSEGWGAEAAGAQLATDVQDWLG